MRYRQVQARRGVNRTTWGATVETTAKQNPRQCPTCGRCDQDWKEQTTRSKTLLEGVKAVQRSAEDRMRRYREYRRTFGDGLYANDLDQVEWRMIEGAIKPVAVLELTRVDGNATVPQTYLTKVLDRVSTRDPQAKVACEMARRMSVSAFLVCFRWDCSEFWVYNLTSTRGWWHLTPAKYRAWIASLQ